MWASQLRPTLAFASMAVAAMCVWEAHWIDEPVMVAVVFLLCSGIIADWISRM